MEKGSSQVEKKNWGNNVAFRSLNYRYRVVFKLKRNKKKLIDDWDVKIEKK
jgi:hypothetical protein